MRIQLPGTTMAPRVCRQCGKTFLGGPRAWYCPDCRAERNKKAVREYRQRKKAGHSIVLGKTIGHCARCGKEFVYAAARQKYCKECAEEASAEVDRIQGRGWLRRTVEKHGRRYADERNAAKRLDRTNCIDCGAPLEPGHGASRMYCKDCKRLHLRYSRYKTDIERHYGKSRTPVSFEDWKAGKR